MTSCLGYVVEEKFFLHQGDRRRSKITSGKIEILPQFTPFTLQNLRVFTRGHHCFCFEAALGPDSTVVIAQ